MRTSMDAGTRPKRRAVLEALGFGTAKLKDESLIPTETVIAMLVVLEAFGFTPTQIRTMASRHPTMLECGPRQVSDALFSLSTYRLTASEIMHVVFRQPQILTSKHSTVEKRFVTLMTYGIDWSELCRIATKAPNVLYNSTEYTLRQLTGLEQLGFTKAEVIRLVTLLPTLLVWPLPRIKHVFSFFGERGVSAERVVMMATKFGNLLRLEPSRLGEVADAISDTGLPIDVRPNAFGFSPTLLRGRIAFLKRRGETKWPGWLFQSNPQFEKRYGITRERVIALDPGPEAFRPPLRPVLRD